MDHQYDCEQKTHILLIFLLTQYISSTQKILTKENIRKLGQISPNLGNLLAIFKKTVKMKKIKKFRTTGKPVPLRLTAVSAIDAAMYEKMFGSGRHPSDLDSHMTALIISNKELNDIMKLVKSLEELSLLIKGARETTKNET